MKLVYVLGGNYGANGMGSIITKKINWYAEHTDWEIVALLTESAKGREFYFPLHPSVKVVNFELDFDELDTLPKLQKILRYRSKQKLYKRKFTDFLMEYRPDVVVLAMRREINFLCKIKDGSKKVGELHFCRKIYRVFSHPNMPALLCRLITRMWQEKLIKQIRRLDAFVVLTEEDKAAWGELHNMHVIPNFITRIPALQNACEAKSVMAVGRYTWQKGFDLLLEAWKKVEEKQPGWTLRIIGDGDRTAYENQARALGLQNVMFEGATKDLENRLQDASIFAFSSRYEGFGMVLIEAMAKGLPVVSFACPCGPADIVTDGEDGFLVHDFDTNAFAERLLWLIENEERRREMGQHARDNMHRFLQDDVMRLWMTLFDRLQTDRQ